MTDRTSLLETALENLPDGLAVFDSEGCVVFWNAAAEAITGYAAAELLSGVLPTGLKPLLQESSPQPGTEPMSSSIPGRGTQVRTRHKFEHEFPVIVRVTGLRDGAGAVIGTTVQFHPAERLDALPHGESGEDQSILSSQTEFEERLYAEYEDFESGGPPLGVFWIVVDQAHDLHKTHGVAACHAMLEKIQRALASGLRPGEELARWGEDEFLILAHERTPLMLARHARTLTGLARTADFRWWGDRISLTVSIGAAQALRHQPLQELLGRAKKAMETSSREGGNRVTCTPRNDFTDSDSGEDQACSPS